MTETPKKSRAWIWTIAIIVCICVIWAIYYFIFKNQTAPVRDMRVAVAVTTVKQENAPLKINALGTVDSTYTAVVRSRVDGELVKIYFKEGQFVKAGQLLAELDNRPFKAALQEAQGQLMRDKALLQNARIDLIRYKALLAQNSIARQQVDTQASLVKQYEGSVKLDQGVVDNAKLQLTYSRIVAPISGRVGLLQIDLGNIVHASDTNGIVTITQEEPINVVFAIPEVDLSSILSAYHKNPQLTVEAWDRDNKQPIAVGQLLAIDNQLNTQTGTINIKARFENKNHELFPNQFINVFMHLGDKENAIVVPTVAISLGKLGHTVYRVNENQTVSLVKVKVGATSGENSIIEEGLEPGQIVVVDGLDKLRDGATIRIVEHRLDMNKPQPMKEESNQNKL